MEYIPEIKYDFEQLISETKKLERKMRKRLCLLSLLLIPVLFTSCIDYVQSITYKDGKYQMYYKITFSKVIFAMGGMDPDQLLNSIDNEKMKNFPANAEIKPVNTDLEIGEEIILHIDPRTTDETEKSFLPKVDGKKCFIRFFLGGNDDTVTDSMKPEKDKTEDMVKDLVSTAKCRVIISKKIIPEIESAYFEGRDGQDYSIPLFDYGELYCMEIPFVVTFENDKYKFDRIVIIKK